MHVSVENGVSGNATTTAGQVVEENLLVDASTSIVGCNVISRAVRTTIGHKPINI